MQKQHSGARSQTGEQIIKREAHRADDAFQARADDKERVEIHDEMKRTQMEKKRGHHPPVFAAEADRPRFERTEPMQSDRIHRATEPNFRAKHRDVQRNENEDRPRWPPRFGTESAGGRAIALFDPMKQSETRLGKRRFRDGVGAMEALGDF